MKHFHRLFYPPAWTIAAKISAALVSAALIPIIFTAYYNLQQSLESVVVVGGITAIIALILSLSISRPIHALTIAAQALESDDFDSHVLELRHILVKLGHPQDDIGRLVRVFLEMAEEVRMRDQQTKMQVQELRIEIDETKRASHVAEITENEHFQQLQKKIQKLKEHEVTVSETEAEYYRRLQSKVQSLKNRSLNGETGSFADGMINN